MDPVPVPLYHLASPGGDLYAPLTARRAWDIPWQIPGLQRQPSNFQGQHISRAGPGVSKRQPQWQVRVPLPARPRRTARAQTDKSTAWPAVTPSLTAPMSKRPSEPAGVPHKHASAAGHARCAAMLSTEHRAGIAAGIRLNVLFRPDGRGGGHFLRSFLSGRLVSLTDLRKANTIQYNH